ncbi:hypothetical protein GCM10028791_05880 [Echinicola sediminis]
MDLIQAHIGDIALNLEGAITETAPIDRSISLSFSQAINPASIADAISLSSENGGVNFTTNLISNNRTLTINTVGTLETNSLYQLEISNTLLASSGASFPGKKIQFKTLLGELEMVEFNLPESENTRTNKTQEVPVDFRAELLFSSSINRESLEGASKLSGPSSSSLQFVYADNDRKVTITSSAPLEFIARYEFSIEEGTIGAEGEDFAGFSKEFYTVIDDTPKFPILSEEALLTKVQEQTFKYFWDFAHPTSGLARERNSSGNTVTIGGSGFGVMSLIVGVERGFITRKQALDRWTKIVDFLAQADRFHGVWPHWMNGSTGTTIRFSAKDNGGDLVETAFMVQGLLTVRAYLSENDPSEKNLIDKISALWETVEWDWYTKGGGDVLFWHWSPQYNWEMNLPVRGYNESLIVYVLAAASPTHPIEKRVYDAGWARNGNIRNGQTYYQHQLPLGNDYGGPLFFAHYSFVGLDPRNLSDQYANYWEQNIQHSLINQAHAVQNPKGFIGYSEENWGFTASDNESGYSAHSPTNDRGVITPTAALSSYPYTPEKSQKALEFFYYNLGDKLWGEYGFYDAFNLTESWYADSYLAIDQGPIILMIENYRSALLWDLFMSDQEIKSGLDKLDFNY